MTLEALDPKSLLEIFLEEARNCSNRSNRTDGRNPPMTQARWSAARNLHHEGGARLADVDSLGNLSHALESAFESVVERRIGSEPPEAAGTARHRHRGAGYRIPGPWRDAGCPPRWWIAWKRPARGRQHGTISPPTAAIDDESPIRFRRR